MSNEAANRFAGAPERGGHPRRSGGDRSPFQARAAFIKNWDWESVVRINRGACERGGAQYGANSETHEACAADWEAKSRRVLTLAETLDLLRSFHRRAPFLFFNGNTFAAIGRELTRVLFGDLPPVRNREISSAVAHYIAGVLDREPMVEIVESLCASAELKAGDRVKTLRGSLRGAICRVLDDGRVLWLPDGGARELVALPETLMKVE
ncbi:MAG: hypothetical protein FJ395_12040 [Verrucomicrobia bacterium]|nr:hypothetical protein [Verrucomicrobiota bacterium]